MNAYYHALLNSPTNWEHAVYGFCVGMVIGALWHIVIFGVHISGQSGR